VPALRRTPGRLVRRRSQTHGPALLHRLGGAHVRQVLRIEAATPGDLGDVKDAYAHGRRIQRDQGTLGWPEFTDAAILAEINDGRLFKVHDGDALAGVFSVTYDDGPIWGARERGAHIYIHRIARAASFTGRGLLDAIFAWSDGHCASLGRDGLRMDTWASNIALIKIYERHGFQLLGFQHIGQDPRLAAHYHDNDFALLERNLVKS
jgi:GNAT superfamily N-acetyltransferase